MTPAGGRSTSIPATAWFSARVIAVPRFDACSEYPLEANPLRVAVTVYEPAGRWENP